MEVRRITERKEAVLTEMLGDMQPLLAPDVPKFMESLSSSKVCFLVFPLLCQKQNTIITLLLDLKATRLIY